jgi:hypothetical protein
VDVIKNLVETHRHYKNVVQQLWRGSIRYYGCLHLGVAVCVWLAVLLGKSLTFGNTVYGQCDKTSWLCLLLAASIRQELIISLAFERPVSGDGFDLFGIFFQSPTRAPVWFRHQWLERQAG